MASEARRGLLRYSPWDGLALAVVLLSGVAEIGFALVFERMGWASLVAATVVLFVWRASAGFAVHNFLHTPFFRSKVLNRIALVLSSAAGSAMPISAVARGHLYHHRNAISFNDFRLRDVYAPSQIAKLAVAMVLDPFMLQFVGLWAKLTWGKPGPAPEIGRRTFKSHGEYNAHIGEVVLTELRAEPELRRQVLYEALAIIAFRVALCAISWRFFFFYWLPFLFVSILYGFYDDYCQHYGTYGDDPLRDSVSSYGKIYNFLLFNIGYHQEHHLRPGVHWLKLPRVRAEMLPEDQRRVVPVCLLTNRFVPFDAEAARRSASKAPAAEAPAAPWDQELASE